MRTSNLKIRQVGLVLCLASLVAVVYGADAKDAGTDRSGLTKVLSIQDRAAGVHDAGNIGMFFENRGKLYPRRAADGPYGEFPINSGRHYIYRINPMVGVAADPASGRLVNVIQGRYTTNEEWEAAAGYKNPDLAKVAFSDDPITWPPYGWPVQDSAGNPIILSDQDSYCVYNDSNNTIQVLGVAVIQTGYVFASRFAEDIIFYKFEIVNNGPIDLDSVFFALYFDCDVGNISGGEPEYGDDLVGFDQAENLLYMYDSDGYSAEWGGATGYFATTFIQTPLVDGEELGITEMHYNLYDYDLDNDSLQYAILSSDLSYVPGNIQAVGNTGNYFHPGSAGNTHYDDPATQPVDGQDVLGTASSGPYFLARNDTLTFVTAVLAGVDLTDLYLNLKAANDVVASGFNPPKPPPSPVLGVEPGDGRVRLFWGDLSEKVIDEFSGEMDFEGYRIYKSIDYGATWDQIDRNINPATGEQAVPLVEFDIINDVGDNTGLQYSYIDSNVVNGFEYWYSLTAFDRGSDILESLESPIGKKLESVNTVSAVPRSAAVGRLPVRSQSVQHLGSGSSNYVLAVEPVDIDSLAGHQYDISFGYEVNRVNGDLTTELELIVTDSSRTVPYHFGIEFISETYFIVKNLISGATIGREIPYRTGVVFKDKIGYGLNFMLTEPAEPILPENGDLLAINFVVNVDKDETHALIQGRLFAVNKPYAASDGFIFTLRESEDTLDVTPPLLENFSLAFSVSNADVLIDTSYVLVVSETGLDFSANPFVSLAAYYDDLGSYVLVDTVDSLQLDDTFVFDGIEVAIEELDGTDLPAVGTVFALRSVPSVMPSLLDVYRVQLQGSTVAEQVAKDELEQIRVVPNPYVVSSLWEREFGELRREPIRQLQFINLPSRCTIYIFTVAGDLVQKLEHDSPGGTEVWDLRAEGGREIAPGIYLYLVKTESREYLNRFAVIK